MEWEGLPVPAFVVDKELRILAYSREASKEFQNKATFWELLDPDSLIKAEQFLAPSRQRSVTELNMITNMGKPSLYDIYLSWDKQGLGALVCCEKQSYANRVHDTVRTFRAALEDNQKQEKGLYTGHRSNKLESSLSLVRTPAQETIGILNTVRELVMVLKPALGELDKAEYVDLIMDHLDLAGKLLKE